MILVTEAGYHGIVALSACSTRPLSASTTSQASALATPDVATASSIAITRVWTAAIDFSGELPSNERINCTIRFRSFETRLDRGGLECDVRTEFRDVRRRRLRLSATYTGLPFENRGWPANSRTKWAEFRRV